MAGRGGARAGAGRKSSELKRRWRTWQTEKAKLAEEVMEFLAVVMRDTTESKKLRVQCALEIRDTAWGKPKAVEEHGLSAETQEFLKGLYAPEHGKKAVRVGAPRLHAHARRARGA